MNEQDAIELVRHVCRNAKAFRMVSMEVKNPNRWGHDESNGYYSGDEITLIAQADVNGARVKVQIDAMVSEDLVFGLWPSKESETTKPEAPNPFVDELKKL